MKPQPSYAASPTRRDLMDPRSTGAPTTQPRKALLSDRRSTR